MYLVRGYYLRAAFIKTTINNVQKENLVDYYATFITKDSGEKLPSLFMQEGWSIDTATYVYSPI